MKRVLLCFLAILFVSFGLSACRSVISKVVHIDARYGTCYTISSAPSPCLKVKEEGEEHYRPKNIEIIGFTYEPGFYYSLRISETPVKNPLTGAPTVSWRLLSVLEKEMLFE